MTIETFPIKLYSEVMSLTDSENVTHYPGVQVLFDDTIMFDQTLEPVLITDETDSLLPNWMDIQAKEDDKNIPSNIAVVEFNIELDDDIDTSHILKINVNYDVEFIDSITQVNPETGDRDEFGFYIKDIELNEISIESLVYTNGIVNVPLCLEENYEDDGFIQEYLIPEGLMDKLSIIDGRYHYITNGDYVHMPGSSYSMEFKTPLYLWLLELLLQ